MWKLLEGELSLLSRLALLLSLKDSRSSQCRDAESIPEEQYDGFSHVVVILSGLNGGLKLVVTGIPPKQRIGVIYDKNHS